MKEKYDIWKNCITNQPKTKNCNEGALIGTNFLLGLGMGPFFHSLPYFIEPLIGICISAPCPRIILAPVHLLCPLHLLWQLPKKSILQNIINRTDGLCIAATDFWRAVVMWGETRPYKTRNCADLDGVNERLLKTGHLDEPLLALCVAPSCVYNTKLNKKNIILGWELPRKSIWRASQGGNEGLDDGLGPVGLAHPVLVRLNFVQEPQLLHPLHHLAPRLLHRQPWRKGEHKIVIHPLSTNQSKIATDQGVVGRASFLSLWS